MNKYNLEIPKVLDIYGKKPWEIPMFDLADEWRQQSRTPYSLNEVVYELDMLGSVDEILGKNIHNIYQLFEKYQNYLHQRLQYHTLIF